LAACKQKSDRVADGDAFATHGFDDIGWWFRMATSNAFALKNSGLNEFLFAEVGTEANGSPLTILSVLARLGRDPWAEAARWTKLPQASIIDCLADCISQMPLLPQCLVEAHTTAARLILLLPRQAQPLREEKSEAKAKSVVPEWLPVVAFLAALAFGIGFEMMLSTPPAAVAGHVAAPPTVPVNQ
jgi:hypothetical protein